MKILTKVLDALKSTCKEGGRGRWEERKEMQRRNCVCLHGLLPSHSLTGAPPKEWHVEVAYKTVRGPRTGTGREAEQQQEAGVTGESLYVVKSSAAPGRVYMLV